MSYVNAVLEKLVEKDPHQSEFIQAATEALNAIAPVFDCHPEFEKEALLERLVEPERVVQFRVPWVDDSGRVQVNRGYRVQYNSAIGPYKGGIRLHPTVNLSIMKCLAFEQTFKNSLTGLAMGGGKGGSDFNPKGKSDREVMAFCQSFMNELYRHIGADCDVPAGDIGVGAREIGYLYGQYKRLTTQYEGVLTGKGIPFGGSLARKEATGFGLCYLTDALLRKHGMSFENKRVVISGSGNVAIYAAQKATELGAKVIAMSDSNGYVVDESGIKLDIVKQIKEVERGRIKEYAARVPGAVYTEGCVGIWTVPCDLAMPCATQNELPLEGAQALVKNGVISVTEGANMPTTAEATQYLQQHKVLFVPGKAANAGGVSVSGLEMSQNSLRLSWSFEEVDARLRTIMENIFIAIDSAAKEYGDEDNYVLGANIAGFAKVAQAMLAQGAV